MDGTAFGIQTDPRDLANYIQTENARLRQQYLDEIRLLQGRLMALGGFSPFDYVGYPRSRRRTGYRRKGYRRKSTRRRRAPLLASSQFASPLQKYVRARVPTARSKRCRDSKGAFIRCR